MTTMNGASNIQSYMYTVGLKCVIRKSLVSCREGQGGGAFAPFKSFPPENYG